jgi:Tol biopolymer transport system component
VEAPDDRLDSWKEIAAYLRRDVTTVQRWERREGMPVRRHTHDKLGSVYAFRSELDAWKRKRDLVSTTPAPSFRRSVLPWLSLIGFATVLLVAAVWLVERRGNDSRNPLANARFENVTNFGGNEQAAALSRDGRLVAFLSDRDGTTDVWVTQLGTGQFYNLTRGHAAELVNPSVRTLGFTADGAFVTFWTRRTRPSLAADISISAVPTLGGPPKPYLEDAAELDFSADGTRMIFHTPAAGDPMFLRDNGTANSARPLFTAASGLHAHYPVWSPSGDFIYFVQGMVPDAMDIWRIKSTGDVPPERVTSHNSHVSHPVFLNPPTLMYLATTSDGAGPWVYSLDPDHPAPNRVSAGIDRYSSLSASADGSRLVATVAKSKPTLWRLPLDASSNAVGLPVRIPLTTEPGSAPRCGPDYLLYVSSKGQGDAIWKLANGIVSELWSQPDARILAGPEIAPDGHRVAFTVAESGTTTLRLINDDGTGGRVVTASLPLRGAPTWAPDGQSITSSVDSGTPHLVRIALDGRAAPLTDQYSLDPSWSLDGSYLVYSGADIGTRFEVKAVRATEWAESRHFILSRGARRMRFLQAHLLLVLRGELQHKTLWLIDLDSGAERQLINLPADFDVVDFDVAVDRREIVLERMQQQSDVVLIDLAHARN